MINRPRLPTRKLFNRRAVRAALTVLTAGVATTPSTWVEAASSEVQLDEIIVTARKQTEDVQRVPAAVSVLGAQQIRDAHYTVVDDLAYLIPNLNITTRADNTLDVVMRGVGGFGITPGVGFYVNDVQLFEGQTVRAEDIERIEVLKGPQGTLYGGNNIGGAIKYITKKPTTQFSAEGTVEGGNYNTLNASAAVSGPIAGDSLGARLSLFDTTSDGFVFDPTLNRHLGRDQQRGARLTLEYQPNDKTDAAFYLSGFRQRSDNENLYYAAVDSSTYSRTTTANVSPHFNRDIYSPTLQIEHALGAVVRLTSISSYFHSDIDARADGDHRAAPFFDVTQRFLKNNWSQELRLASAQGWSWRWVVGAFYQSRESRDYEANTQMLSIVTGDPADDGVFVSASQHSRKEYALFGNASYDVGPWTLEVGLRTDHFRNRLTDTIAAIAYQRSGSETLPKASISYHFTDDVMGYATVTRGLQPADVLQSHAEISTYDSEKTENYELGLKSAFLDRRLRFNVAAFYIDYDNRLFSTIDGATLQEVTRNVGPSRNYGVEVDAAARVTGALTLSAAFGVTRALWGNIPGYYNPNTDTTINLVGLKAPYAPSYQGTLTLDWTHSFSNAMSLSARIDASFTGPQWWNISDDYSQEAYQVVNAGVRFDLSSHWQLAANIRNLFDEQYNPVFAGGPDIGSPFNTAGFSRPRQWFISATCKL